ncbi:MAG TPA: prephenate dehydrogenase [Planctomycetota bacterium]|nr:prephenate dehydrogenase [Planctomycetota bacterium]
MIRPTVAIVGLGQIGGSFAAALTKRRLARVVGVTRRSETASRARRMGILAEAGTDLAAVATADIVVLATPVRTLLRQIPQVAALVPKGSILTDVGSTKTDIVDEFHRVNPAATVVAGHPMAGNERAGLDGCDPHLFDERPWVLVGDRRKALLLERLVVAIGARPLWMKSPQDHDLKVARVSHIPYLLAYALMGTPEDSVRVCGNSFRDATRVAASDPDMVLDFLLTNRGPIRRSAGELRRRLDALLRSIDRGDAAGLRRKFARAREVRSRI